MAVQEYRQLTLEDLGNMPDSHNPHPLSAGVDKTQSNFQRASGVLANAVGATDIGRSLEEAADANEKLWRQYKPEVASYKDIDSLGSLLSYVGGNIGLEAPNIAVSLLGKVGLAASAINMFGETVNEQIHRGEDVNLSRAAITGGLEGMLNLPLNKAFGNVMKTLDQTALSPVQKGNVMGELVKGITTDAGTNGVQHLLREYGVDGEFDTANLDEAIIGGIVTTAPIRLSQTLASKVNQDKMSTEAADSVVHNGDVTKADNFLNQGLNFMVGTALRPVRRIKETEAGKALLERIHTMRIENDTAKSGWTNEIQEVFKNSKLKPAELRARYAKGDRSLPELKQLESVLGDVHQRANYNQGANLKTGKIANWLPTRIDKKDFGSNQQTNLYLDYTRWYNEQADKTGLVLPKEARIKIKQFAKKLESQTDENPAKMTRVRVDSNGDVVSSSGRQGGDTPLRQGQLENTRTLGFIPQKLLNDYSMDKNFQEQILSYVQGAAHRITYAEQLGSDNQRINQLVAQTNKELKKQGSQSLTRAEVDTIYNAMDAYQGTYGQFQSKVGRRTASIIRSATNIVALPLTALSSLTEPFNVAIKVGNVAAGKAFIKSLASMSQDVLSWTTNGVVRKSEVARQLALTGRAFKDATTALNARVEGQHLTQAEQNINNVFFHATGQTAINYLVNSMAVHAMQAQVKTDIQLISGSYDNVARAEALERMSDLGISEAQAGAMASNNNIVTQFMPDMVTRFNRDVALKPDALDKPVWQSTGWGATFTQLRGYPTMFSNTVLPKLADLIDPRGKSIAENAQNMARFAVTAGAILTIGYMQEGIKNELRGNNLSDEEVFMKGARNTLVPIQASYMLDLTTGNAQKVFLPASVSIVDQNVKLLQRAINGEATGEEIPVLSSFKGVL